MKLNNLDFREDGRQSGEIRRIQIENGVHNAQGFVTLRQGNSCVRVVCNGPKEGNRILFNVTFSKTSRQETINDKRIYDFEDTLQKIFCETILIDNQLEIEVEVIQQDGSLISVMVNCIFMALCYSGVPILDSICSVTLSEQYIDLRGSEESGRNAILLLVYYVNRDQVVYVRSTGRISKIKFESLIDKGKEAAKEIFGHFKQHLHNINSLQSY